MWRVISMTQEETHCKSSPRIVVIGLVPVAVYVARLRIPRIGDSRIFQELHSSCEASSECLLHRPFFLVVTSSSCGEGVRDDIL